MKKTLILAAFILTVSVTGFTQRSYSVLTNRVLISALVNNDTLIIENTKNVVRLNGELELLEVKYNNLDSRVVSPPQSTRELKSDITIKFGNEYSWLDERVKSTENQVSFSDELIVTVAGEEETIQAEFIFSNIRGGQGFLTMIEITGEFSPDALQYDFPDLMFKEDLKFKIILQVQVTD